MTVPLTRFTVISCAGATCTAQYVGDLQLDMAQVRTARVPIINRALAAAGWATVGRSHYCARCFDRLWLEASTDKSLRALERELDSARSVRRELQGIEVG